MKKSELKKLIIEVVEEVSKMENPCWKGYKAYGTKNKGGKEVPNCVPVKEGMSGEEYAKDIQTSKGVFKYWMEEDREPDNMKLFFYVKGPDGKVHDVDMNPYEHNPYSPENIEKVKNWIESGMPKTKINETEVKCGICGKDLTSPIEECWEESYESPKWDMIPEGDEHTCEGDEFYECYGDWNADATIEEAEYHGRKVKLGVPMKGDVKKSKVYVKNPKGNVVKVNFGDKNMRIKKSNPKRRKSFRARHNCANPGPRTSAKYWSCRAW
jgi:hypothetical protein